VIAVVLIIVIAGVSVGKVFLEKYSYSKERADLDEYFSVDVSFYGMTYMEIVVCRGEFCKEKQPERTGEGCFLQS